jgi:hypothetical protein
MLPEQWGKAVADVVEQSGSRWTVFIADCDQGSLTCFARLVKEGEQSKQIKLSLADFETHESIKAEIARQLAAFR